MIFRDDKQKARKYKAFRRFPYIYGDFMKEQVAGIEPV